jgi:hypothetical protein
MSRRQTAVTRSKSLRRCRTMLGVVMCFLCSERVMATTAEHSSSTKGLSDGGTPGNCCSVTGGPGHSPGRESKPQHCCSGTSAICSTYLTNDRQKQTHGTKKIPFTILQIFRSEKLYCPLRSTCPVEQEEDTPPSAPDCALQPQVHQERCKITTLNKLFFFLCFSYLEDGFSTASCTNPCARRPRSRRPRVACSHSLSVSCLTP